MEHVIRLSKANSHRWSFYLHSINKGKIGELAVRKDLVQSGYNIYLPECDTAQVDLIVETANGHMKRVQIKAVSRANKRTAIEVNTTKYKNSGRVDVIAVYYAPKDIIAYVPYENTHAITLAMTTGKNNQSKKRKWFYSYERFPEFK